MNTLFIRRHFHVEQLWKEWDRKANKQGLLHTVYFSNGCEYTGEWLDNRKQGKGIYVWKNKNVYSGDFKNNMKDGFGTLSVKSGNAMLKRYSGQWKNNKKHGFGICNYDQYTFYEGDWQCGMRHGWGRMVYRDKSIYEGEWERDLRSGQGILKYANGSRYEGEWKNDMKNGHGKFVYYEKGQSYDGVWVDDIAKCGQISEFEQEFLTSLTIHAIPELGLLDPQAVLKQAQEDLFAVVDDE